MLHQACYYGHPKVVKALLPHTSPFVVDNKGHTPLHAAAKSYNTECVEILLSLNPPIPIRNKNGKTPAAIATYKTDYILREYIKDHHERLQID